MLKLYKNGPFGSLGLDVTNVKLLSYSQKNSAHLVDENPPRFKSKIYSCTAIFHFKSSRNCMEKVVKVSEMNIKFRYSEKVT